MKKILMFIAFIFFVNFSYSQSQNDTIKQILKRLSKLEAKSNLKIGYFSVNLTNNIDLFEISKRKRFIIINERSFKKAEKQVKIDSIFIQIKKGSIYEVLAFTDKGSIFHANDYPISIENFFLEKKLKKSNIEFMMDKKKSITNSLNDTSAFKTNENEVCYKKFKEENEDKHPKKRHIKQYLRVKKRKEKKAYKVRNIKNPREYFKLRDVLTYIPEINNHFIPKDTVFKIFRKETLTKKDTIIGMDKGIYLSTYIKAAIYSDFYSLFDEKPNGVIQTDFSSEINLNIISIPGFYGYSVKYIKPYFSYSKFDNEFQTYNLDLLNPDKTSFTPLVRQANFKLGLQLNLFQGELGNRFESDLSIGTEYLTTKVISKKQKGNTNIIGYFIEGKVLVKEYHNFGLSIKGRYTKYKKPKFTNINTISNFEKNKYLTLSTEVYYYPIKDKENKIFLRFRYISNFQDRENDYTALQFGYQVALKFKQK